MRESAGVWFLYKTAAGRILLKGLTQPWVSRLAGRILDARASACLIPFFIRKYRISLRDVVLPEGGFRSFNQFFCRKERRIRAEGAGEEQGLLGESVPKAGFREREVRQGTLLWRNDLGELRSPCDAFLSVIPIRKDVIFDVKHTRFTLKELLKDEELAGEFQNGLALIFRLTPSHYHRYCFAADGEILSEKKIAGILHCVRPIVTGEIPVYAQNAREYQVIGARAFGKIVQMEVGALLIGRITNPMRKSRRVRAGEEKGYFEFGGSTVVLLIKRDFL